MGDHANEFDLEGDAEIKANTITYWQSSTFERETAEQSGGQGTSNHQVTGTEEGKSSWYRLENKASGEEDWITKKKEWARSYSARIKEEIKAKEESGYIYSSTAVTVISATQTDADRRTSLESPRKSKGSRDMSGDRDITLESSQIRDESSEMKIKTMETDAKIQCTGEPTTEKEARDRILLICELFRESVKIKLRSDACKRSTVPMAVAGELRDKGIYLEDKVGVVKGVHPGEEFFSRAEMYVLGLHKSLIKGIAAVKGDRLEEFVATSICMSGKDMYADNKWTEDGLESCVYSGEGGIPRGTKEEKKAAGYADQKLEGGNKALMTNYMKGLPLRRIQGFMKDDKRVAYIYCGLYKVSDWNFTKGVNGNMVYKFVLTRYPGQPPVRISFSGEAL